MWILTALTASSKLYICMIYCTIYCSLKKHNSMHKLQIDKENLKLKTTYNL